MEGWPKCGHPSIAGADVGGLVIAGRYWLDLAAVGCPQYRPQAPATLVPFPSQRHRTCLQLELNRS